MSIGSRRENSQGTLWIPAEAIPQSPGHPFYQKLSTLLHDAGFDEFVHSLCSPFYASGGRPSIPPGNYFRMLLIGYFEGISSERGIEWRCTDSLSLRSFLGLSASQRVPDHSSLSRIRRRFPLEVHLETFEWILRLLADNGLLKGETLGIDATTLEANAAMRSIVRRDTGESYDEFLTGLAKASGIETPTKADLVKVDKTRKNKASNKDWQSPGNPDSGIAKMKTGGTHLAHKAEHAVDLDTDAIVAVEVYSGETGDTTSGPNTLDIAVSRVEHLHNDGAAGVSERVTNVVADKGYESDDVLKEVEQMGVNSYIAAKDTPRNFTDKPNEQKRYNANKNRLKSELGEQLRKKRSEKVERSMAHMYLTGKLRHLWLRGRENILKRLLIHAGAFNLGLVLRQLTGYGTPRGLANGLRRFLSRNILTFWQKIRHPWPQTRQNFPQQQKIPHFKTSHPSPTTFTAAAA